MPVTDPSRADRRLLIVVASALEAAPVLRALAPSGEAARATPGEWQACPAASGIDLVISGVGKANAAAAVGRFADPARHAAILSIGIAGLLPVGSEFVPGQAVLGSVSHFADEGILTPSGWQSCAQMGFPLCSRDTGTGLAADPGLLATLRPAIPLVAPIATVSTCSGTDALASQVLERTWAYAEAMEGAAVLLAASRLGIPAAELRVISNTTGERTRQRWEMKAALSGLEAVIGRIAPLIS